MNIRKLSVLGLALGISAAYGQSHEWAQRAAAAEKSGVLKTMETLVNMDSGTDDGKGLALVEAELARRLTALGATVEISAASPSAGNVVVGRLKGKGSAKIMSMIHYDTVFPVGEAARRPFRLEGQRVYGPGAADAKGGAALILHAGSAPEKGRNAAMELAFQLLQLSQLGDTIKGTTVNWTVVQSGDRSNIIPQTARATADMRMSVLSEVERVQRDVDRIIQRKYIPENEVQVKVEYRRPPFQRNAQTDQLVNVANRIHGEIGKSLEPVAMRFGTDAGFASTPNSAKPVVLDGLGVVGDRIHSSDEFVETDSIVPRLYLTMRLIEELCQSASYFPCAGGHSKPFPAYCAVKPPPMFRATPLALPRPDTEPGLANMEFRKIKSFDPRVGRNRLQR